MSRCAAVLSAVLLLALALRAEGPAEDPAGDAVECEIRTLNGSAIRGRTSGARELRLRVKKETKSYRLRNVRSVTWGVVRREELDRVMTKDGVVAGGLEETGPFALDTGYGVLTIPAEEIASIRVSQPGEGFALDFESGTLDGWSMAGRSTWSAEGGALTVQPAGLGDTLVFEERLDGRYALEVDVTCTDWAAILFHVDGNAPSVALWVIPGSVGMYGNGNWTSTLMKSWPAAIQAGKPARVRLDVDGKHVKISVDGVVAGEIDVPVESGKIGFGCWTKPATFDNLTISR
ncbi:MAG: hypothetical protein HYY18_01715 [Planctomycetes bacterium]|nr:hypothetical protein [Planctomycetota bacterium]